MPQILFGGIKTQGVLIEVYAPYLELRLQPYVLTPSASVTATSTGESPRS